jgi:hypothetical protein
VTRQRGRKIKYSDDDRLLIKKEAAPCCMALRDEQGRLQPGFCDRITGVPCIRRQQKDHLEDRR